MIWEIVSGFLGGATVINGIAVILVYRQYLKLASESMEFAALVVTSIQEQEDGSVTIDPLALADTSMDHISQLSGCSSGFGCKRVLSLGNTLSGLAILVFLVSLFLYHLSE